MPADEKLVAQLTSRQKLYDSKGRERLESKADLRSRGVVSPDRADALIGAIMLGIFGHGGAITAADMPWITFGRSAFGPGEPVTFDEEERLTMEGVQDVSQVGRYPFI